MRWFYFTCVQLWPRRSCKPTNEILTAYMYVFFPYLSNAYLLHAIRMYFVTPCVSPCVYIFRVPFGAIEMGGLFWEFYWMIWKMVKHSHFWGNVIIAVWNRLSCPIVVWNQWDQIHLHICRGMSNLESVAARKECVVGRPPKERPVYIYLTSDYTLKSVWYKYFPIEDSRVVYNEHG